ncbi:hypothetical protein [Desertivirga arenae]|uniref:hypothetical protein n=1 Tax=Desertivirga arenae TaxID=2810309 RepID=UPI001A9731C1|nr:hypothetical protein [Pedobacter sp. SYSU D00823]
MKDQIASTKAVFTRSLPDPITCSSSTITLEKTIGIRRVTFIAQKVKNASGYSWNVYYNAVISPIKTAMHYYHNFN